MRKAHSALVLAAVLAGAMALSACSHMWWDQSGGTTAGAAASSSASSSSSSSM